MPNQNKQYREDLKWLDGAEELRDIYTSFRNRLDQLEERVSVTEDQINEMKWEV